MLIDVGIVLCLYLVALVLRFDGRVSAEYWQNFRYFIPTSVGIHLLANYLFGLYGRMWRYASALEARRLVLASGVGMSASLLVSSLGGGQRFLPLSVIVIGSVLSLIGFGAVRFQSRLFALRRRTATKGHERVLIVGAGEAAAKLLRDIIRHPSLGIEPVGLVDDDFKKAGLMLLGQRVLGSRNDIPRLVEEHQVDHVLLAIPSATSDVVQVIADLCDQANVGLRVLPSVHETVGGRVTVRDIRDLNIEDLLGRQQVSIDAGAVRALIKGRSILVTGAGGSIGSELTRQVAALDPSRLFLLDKDETLLHDIAVEVPRSETILADIRDRHRVHSVVGSLRPEIVFHAAALKHVPVLERYPQEAFLTNVIGTKNVTDAAVSAGVERFILISTDKAINPTGVMGASKRLAEQIVWSARREGIYCAVRFGNVLGSRGSVIPTFLKQIQRGGPITITDPAMTRYFMSVDEAALLVLQAAALAKGSEVFTLEMGKPVNVLDLAHRLIRLSGRHEDEIPIVTTGLRPGEKLHEDVADDLESAMPSDHPGILVTKPSSPKGGRALDPMLEELTRLALDGDIEELRSNIMTSAGGPLSVSDHVSSVR